VAAWPGARDAGTSLAAVEPHAYTERLAHAPRLGSPVEVALVPAFGINALLGVPALNHLALGILASRSTWLDGVALGPVTFVEHHTRGLQLSALVSYTGGDVTGVQLAGGVSWTEGHVRGLQLGITCFSGPLDGLQIGLLNVGGDVSGVQLGVVNLARTVTGVQVGLLNVARSSTAPVGLFNLVDDTPLRFSVSLSDWALLAVNVKFGGTFLYSLLTLAWTPFATFRVGAGLGTRFGRGLGWYSALELSVQSIWDTGIPGSWATQFGFLAQANIGYQVTGRLALFLGTGLQLIATPPGSSGRNYTVFGITLTDRLTLAPSLVAGVEL
jgi:hypothetical protein